MEPRHNIGIWKDTTPPLDSIEKYFSFGLAFAESVYNEELEKIRKFDFSKVDANFFFKEYVWAVYVSGFNSKVLAKLYPDLLEAYGNFRHLDFTDSGPTWLAVANLIANRAKFDAVMVTAELLQQVPFSEFKEEYLESPKTMTKLGFMGPVTSQHLARNLGMDTIKPDLHLVRLSDFFRFNNAVEMCEFLSIAYDTPKSVVDLILFYTASTYGTSKLPSRGSR